MARLEAEADEHGPDEPEPEPIKADVYKRQVVDRVPKVHQGQSHNRVVMLPLWGPIPTILVPLVNLDLVQRLRGTNEGVALFRVILEPFNQELLGLSVSR